MKKLTIIVFYLVLVCSLAKSQGMITYTWDMYNTKFDISKDMDVQTNNEEKFSASNNDINLTIYPRKGEYLRWSEMNNALSKWANENAVKGWNDVYEVKDLNGYEGVYLDGVVDDFPVFIGLLVHPDYPSNSMYVWISYRKSEREIAKKILLSFTPTY